MVDFKCRHMGVMHFGDAGGVMFGKWGSRIFGWGMVLKVSNSRERRRSTAQS